MSAVTITPAGLLIGFFVFAASVALLWAAATWRSRSHPRRGIRRRHQDDGPIIDLAYLERAIKADEDAAARRRAEDKPLFSKSPGTSTDVSHRLPRDDR